MPGIATEDMIGALFRPRDGIAGPVGPDERLRDAGAARKGGDPHRRQRDRHRSPRRPRDGGRTSAGDVDRTPVVVNAAGPWAGALAATAGIALPLQPIPRHVAVTGPFPGAPERRTLVVDADSTFYFHREGPGVLMGMGGGPDERASFDTRVDEAFIEEQLLPTALRVFPPIEEAGIATTGPACTR